MRSIEVALDVSVIIVENGGSTLSADRAFTTAARGLGAASATAFWRTDVVIATAVVDGQSTMSVRHAAPPGANLVRVSEAAALANRIGTGKVDGSVIDAELVRIRSLRPPYGLTVAALASGVTAGSFARLAGGDWGSVGICAVAGSIGQTVRSLLQRWTDFGGTITVACAALSAFIAALGLRAHLSTIEPATLVASVVYMIPGLALVNGFIDVTSPKYIAAGAQRIAYALLVAGMLATGIAIGVAVAGR